MGPRPGENDHADTAPPSPRLGQRQNLRLADTGGEPPHRALGDLRSDGPLSSMKWIYRCHTLPARAPVGGSRCGERGVPPGKARQALPRRNPSRGQPGVVPSLAVEHRSCRRGPPATGRRHPRWWTFSRSMSRSVGPTEAGRQTRANPASFRRRACGHAGSPPASSRSFPAPAPIRCSPAGRWPAPW